jgi:hypothetical protein
MRSALTVACLATVAVSVVAAFAPTLISAPARAKTMKECAAQWQEMAAAGQTAGMKYRDFSKQCVSGEAPEAPAAETPPPVVHAETPSPVLQSLPAEVQKNKASSNRLPAGME